MPVVLQSDHTMYDISGQVEVFEDKTHAMKLLDVLRFGAFTSAKRSYGFSLSAYWVRLFVDIPSAATFKNPWLLELDYVHYGKIDFYCLDSTGKSIKALQAGDWRGAKNRLFPVQNYAFPLPDVAGKYVIYLRCEGFNTKLFPLKIWKQNALYERNDQSSLYYGVYFGVILALLIYHFILFLYYRRQVGYLFFCGYLLFFLVGELLRGNGNYLVRYAHSLLFSLPINTPQLYHFFFIGITISSVLFYSEGLKIRTFKAKTFRFLVVLVVLIIILIGLVIWKNLIVVSLMINYFAPIILYSVLLVISIRRLWQGYFSSIYFVGSAFCFLGGLLILFFTRSGKLTLGDLWLQNSVGFAFGAELFLLSLGFADAIRRERQTYLSQLEEKYEEIKDALVQGQILERKRVERELHDSIGSLLFGVRASLFGIQPEKLNEMQQKSYQTVEELLLRAEKEIKLVAHNQFPPELEQQGLVVALENYIKDLANLRLTNFQFDTNMPNEMFLGDKTKSELFSIVRELAANILKHARATEAKVSLLETNNYLELIIQDNGCGFDIKKASKGLGLKNLRHRVEIELGGSLDVQSGSNGTKIVIRLNQSIPNESLSE